MFHILGQQGIANQKKQGSTTHLLEWQKSKTLTTPNDDKDVVGI